MTPSIYSLFVLGAILTCILTPIVRFLALQKGFVDCPQRARKVHQQATPRLGGAAILLSFLAVMCLAGVSVPQVREMLWGNNPILGCILLGSLVIFTIGFLDDLARLSPKTKLLGEFVVAGLVVWGANLSFTEIQFLGLGSVSIPVWLGIGLATFWIVGMANAVNLIDGLDGLASGITLAGLVAVSVVGYLGGITSVTWMSTLLIGCLLGFLVYNSRPASIFLGDCGSLTLGYLVGCLTLLASFREGGALDGIFPVLAFALPILDCIFAIFRRMMKGRSPFSPDMEHFHHRLMTKGLSHGKAVLAMWAMAGSCSLVSIAAAFGKGDQLFAVFVFFGLGGFILLRYLGYFRFEFFGEGLSTLMDHRKSTKSIEQAIKEAEQLVANSVDFESLEDCLSKAAEGMRFHQASIQLFHDEGRLGSDLNFENPSVGKVITWRDQEQSGYFSRDKEFVVEFSISGRNFAYGKVQYRFMDGRSSLSVQDEVLLERIHDSISSLAGRLRKLDYSLH
ncbi:undecaprenyl/decaprenyl-phosphate alpha-N-acetylglucosaminyl 1-phosphate transferase [Opitutales bacterium]|nr:undecaprenyl/decaprenyl-phosphate alpha-N-acetylglucosaminyl 1-phosphate transferase [Opitutales bacterium]